MQTLDQIKQAIIADPQNADFTARGIDPLYAFDPQAKILLIGQAPGQQAQDKRRYFDDPSGERLREWLGMSREIFYDPRQLSILPLDFYFPGKGKSGDLPPRKGFAAKWHPQILATMPQQPLTILVGAYAQKFYLGKRAKKNLTATVQAYQEYLPQYLPLVHPSPRNNIWMAKNPWFATDVLPELQKLVHTALTNEETK
jgi:uracil-DNA glycosylase